MQTTQKTERESPWPFVVEARVIAVPQREVRILLVLLVALIAVTAAGVAASWASALAVRELRDTMQRAHEPAREVRGG
jgi:hypothetical protein